MHCVKANDYGKDNWREMTYQGSVECGSSRMFVFIVNVMDKHCHERHQVSDQGVLEFGYCKMFLGEGVMDSVVVTVIK